MGTKKIFGEWLRCNFSVFSKGDLPLLPFKAVYITPPATPDNARTLNIDNCPLNLSSIISQQVFLTSSTELILMLFYRVTTHTGSVTGLGWAVM